MNKHDLRTNILTELKLSIQEISLDFIFIPRQKYFSIDREHCVFDLLFYHLNMQCMMPLYLKFGEIQKHDIELMKINLRTLLKYKLRQEDENAREIQQNINMDEWTSTQRMNIL
jgi:hypothetical protein